MKKYMVCVICVLVGLSACGGGSDHHESSGEARARAMTEWLTATQNERDAVCQIYNDPSVKEEDLLHTMTEGEYAVPLDVAEAKLVIFQEEC